MKQNLIFLILVIFIITLGSAFAQEAGQETDQETASETDKETETDQEAEATSVSVPDVNIRNWDTFPYSLGAGVEFGLNTRDSFAVGYSATLDRFLWNPHTVLGLRGTMYDDLKTVTASEAELTFRLYMLQKWSGVFFAQLGFGAAFYREEERQINTYIMDFSFGYRYYFQKGFLRGFYIEPIVRVGYPFEWGVGIFAGHWFSF